MLVQLHSPDEGGRFRSLIHNDQVKTKAADPTPWAHEIQKRLGDTGRVPDFSPIQPQTTPLSDHHA